MTIKPLKCSKRFRLFRDHTFKQLDNLELRDEGAYVIRDVVCERCGLKAHMEWRYAGIYSNDKERERYG
jgi:hypothetical protein